MRRNAVIARAWRGFADAKRIVTRRGTAKSALGSLGKPPRNDMALWLDATSTHHQSYRAAHPIAPGTAAIICVSSRPHLLEAVIANVTSQADIDPARLDIVYVANSVDEPVDIDLIEQSFAHVSNFRFVTPPAGTSLGSALNLGMDATAARFVAKFDDDDVYGPHHLADSLRAHGYAGAGVVGKHSYYAHLVDSDRMVLRFPGREYSYSSTLAGGTLVIDRERVGDQQFDDISLGEDRAFLAGCHRRGISTFAADRFNFTQVRSTHNTWQPGDDAFMHRSTVVDTALPNHVVNR